MKAKCNPQQTERKLRAEQSEFYIFHISTGQRLFDMIRFLICVYIRSRFYKMVHHYKLIWREHKINTKQDLLCVKQQNDVSIKIWISRTYFVQKRM